MFYWIHSSIYFLDFLFYVLSKIRSASFLFTTRRKWEVQSTTSREALKQFKKESISAVKSLQKILKKSCMASNVEQAVKWLRIHKVKVNISFIFLMIGKLNNSFNQQIARETMGIWMSMEGSFKMRKKLTLKRFSYKKVSKQVFMLKSYKKSQEKTTY